MSTLMVSVSGIRGIIGGGLEPEIIVKYTSAYADWIGTGTVILGRDARITGEMVKSIVIGTLISKGLNVVDIGICPTPTVQYTVKTLNAQGGIAISASHNPNEWNALKLLNGTGQFMTPDENKEMIKLLNSGTSYKEWNEIGKLTDYSEGLEKHLKDVLDLPIINIKQIQNKKFKVVVDCVNGAGVYVIPDLLRKLGCEVIELNCEKTGIFPRLPEPLPENLTETMSKVKETKADFAVVVDPDVDRLVLITDKGEPFSEENTITNIVDFILSKQKGNAVVNLSTTRGVDDVAKKHGGEVFRSPVGEANVVAKMKTVNAVIGGEGSGGVIYPVLHYGRDALVGIVLTLQNLAEKNISLSQLKKYLPQYTIVKRKVEVSGKDVDLILNNLTNKYQNGKINTEDGVRIDFEDHWVHLRKSNTEPIIRMICESATEEKANEYINKYFKELE